VASATSAILDFLEKKSNSMRESIGRFRIEDRAQSFSSLDEVGFSAVYVSIN
jgi:hypothetical protein